MNGVNEVVGMAGVHQVEEWPALSMEYSPTLTFVQDSFSRGDVVVLQHVCVRSISERVSAGDYVRRVSSGPARMDSVRWQ